MWQWFYNVLPSPCNIRNKNMFFTKWLTLPHQDSRFMPPMSPMNSIQVFLHCSTAFPVFCWPCHNMFQTWCWHHIQTKHRFTKINIVNYLKKKKKLSSCCLFFNDICQKNSNNSPSIFHAVSTFWESGLLIPNYQISCKEVISQYKLNAGARTNLRGVFFLFVFFFFYCSRMFIHQDQISVLRSDDQIVLMQLCGCRFFFGRTRLT